MIALLLLTAAQMPPPSPTPGPAAVTVVPRADPQRWVELAVPGGKSSVLRGPGPCRWQACDPAKVDLIPQADGRDCVIVAPEGRHKVFAFPANGGEPIPLLVTVGSPPAPKPDDPPVPPPQPPNPPPADPLLAKLRAAFDVDVPLQYDRRKVAAAVMAAVYAAAVDALDDPTATSVQRHGELTKAVAERLLRADNLPADSLAGCRKVVSLELQAAFPGGPPAMLTDADKVLAKAVYKRASAALAEISK